MLRWAMLTWKKNLDYQNIYIKLLMFSDYLRTITDYFLTLLLHLFDVFN